MKKIFFVLLFYSQLSYSMQEIERIDTLNKESTDYFKKANRDNLLAGAWCSVLIKSLCPFGLCQSTWVTAAPFLVAASAVGIMKLGDYLVHKFQPITAEFYVEELNFFVNEFPGTLHKFPKNIQQAIEELRRDGDWRQGLDRYRLDVRDLEKVFGESHTEYIRKRMPDGAIVEEGEVIFEGKKVNNSLTHLFAYYKMAVRVQ